MKKILYSFIFVLVLGLPFAFSACSSKTKLIAVYSVSFYNDTVSVAVGESVKLEYKVFPVNATNKDVEFTSLDPSSASVTDDGEVTLIKNQRVDVVVRTKDGNYKSTCTIVPLVEPQEISLLSSKTEEKYDATTGNSMQTMVVSVGQSKIIPLVLSPVGASSNVISVTSDSSNVEVVHSADWMIVGKKAGTANITAEYKNATLTFPVWVEPKTSVVVVQQTNKFGTTTNIDLSQDGNKFVGDLYLDLRGNDSLSIKFLDNKASFSNQLKIDALVTSLVDGLDILNIDVCDSFNEYCSRFAQDENYSSFNFIKYIDLNPVADGTAKLLILCDCVNSVGPIQIELNVVVSDNVGKIEPKVNTQFQANEKPVVFVGDSFDVSVDKFAKIEGGSEYLPINADRLTYFYLDGGETSIRPIKTVSGSVYFECGTFTAVSAKKDAKIWVYVAKTANTPEIYDLTQSEIDSDYVKTSITFNVESKIEDIWLEYNGEYLLDGATIALRALVDDEILINDGDNSLLIGIMTKLTDFVPKEDCSWIFEIESSNDVVLIEENKIVLKKDGTAQITIKFSNGVQLYSKTINIVVVM